MFEYGFRFVAIVCPCVAPDTYQFVNAAPWVCSTQMQRELARTQLGQSQA
jgi:hypothetical protein